MKWPVLLLCVLLSACKPLKAKSADDCDCGRVDRPQHRTEMHTGQVLLVVGGVGLVTGAVLLISAAVKGSSAEVGGITTGIAAAPVALGAPLAVHGGSTVPRCKRCEDDD